MKTIIQRIESGDLTRDIDEKGAGGFWDYAGERAEDYVSDCGITADVDYWRYVEIIQEKIYNDLWELIELL